MDLPDENTVAEITPVAASPNLTSTLSSPPCASPAKARMRLCALVSLQQSLHTYNTSLSQKCSVEVSSLGEWVNLVENAVNDITTTVNNLVDANEDGIEERQWLLAKSADLEDHSRRNNLKLCGILESVQSSELKQYATDLFHALLPDLPPIQLGIDPIHRIPKPLFLPDTIPRDVLMRVHIYTTKDQMLMKSRTLGKFPDPYENVYVFADLSKYTMDLRRQLNTITKALRNHNIGNK